MKQLLIGLLLALPALLMPVSESFADDEFERLLGTSNNHVFKKAGLKTVAGADATRHAGMGIHLNS